MCVWRGPGESGVVLCLAEKTSGLWQRWARFGDNLDLLDAPGVLPVKITDQACATKLAICNNIGEAAYAVAGVAAVLVEIIKHLPGAGM